MNLVLQKLGYQENPQFKDIFKKDLCQKIVKSYWDVMIADKGIFLFDTMSNPLRILQRAIKNNQRIRPKQAIYITGLEILCKDKGIRELRQTIDLIAKSKTWNRITKDIAKINAYDKDLNPHGFVKNIEKSLGTFESFRIKSYTLKQI